MVYNRKAISPWSVEREAGIESATVDSNIEVPQYLQPTVDTGFIDEKGFWRGNVSSDKQFILYTDEAIADNGTILTPSVNADGTWPLDMTGFRDIFLAIKPTNAGNYSITAVMGPAGNTGFANLSPVNPAATLRGLPRGSGNTGSSDNWKMTDLFNDNSETLVADVWNIFTVQGRIANQKLLQFQIVNESGGISTIETAFLRVV